MKPVKEYSPFSTEDMLRLFKDHYPIEDNVILKEVFKNNKNFFDVTFAELEDLGFIENGTSIYYHWLTEKGRDYIEEYDSKE